MRQDEECSEEDTFSQASSEISCSNCTEYMDERQGNTFDSIVEKLTDKRFVIVCQVSDCICDLIACSYGSSDRVEVLRQVVSELVQVNRSDQLPDR